MRSASRHSPGARLRPWPARLSLLEYGGRRQGLASLCGAGHGYGMEDRGLFSGRGFWALALLWLPAGVVAQGLVRLVPETGPQGGAGLTPAMLPVLAGSLVLVAPCGLPLALGCRRVWRLGYRRGAWLGLDRAGSGQRGGVGGGRAARTDRDRRVCSGSKRADMGCVVVAGAPWLTAEGRPAAQQGAGRVSGYGREVAVALSDAVVNGPWRGWRQRSSGRQRSRRVARNGTGTAPPASTIPRRRSPRASSSMPAARPPADHDVDPGLPERRPGMPEQVRRRAARSSRHGLTTG